MLLAPSWDSFLDLSSLKKPTKIVPTKDFDDLPLIYCFQNSNLILLSGYCDNSFNFYRDSKLVDITVRVFHRRPISCLTVLESKGLLICGSKDCRISLWKFSWDDPINPLKLISSPFEKTNYVLYGHQEEVAMMNYNASTDILLSLDKEGACLLFSLRLKRLMKKIEGPSGEKLINAMIHDYGVLVGFSKKKAFMFKYTYLIFYIYFYLNFV